MAYSAPTICKCGYIKQNGESCPRCKPKADKEYNRTRRNKEVYDDVYNTTRWRELRELVIKRDKGLCQHCFKDNRVEKGIIVDHIVEISDGGSKWDMNNLELLCRSCSNIKTADEKQKRKSRC